MNDEQRKAYIFAEAYNMHRFLQEDTDVSSANTDKTELVKKLILSNNSWIINNYPLFVESVAKLKDEYKGFLTAHTPEDLAANDVKTFQLKGYNIGYALWNLGNGEVDIVSVFNAEPDVRGIVNELLKTAVENGGTRLDHYDTKLSELYLRNGFIETDREPFNDAYASPYWNYDKYGRPDVVYRKYSKQLTEMLRLI